MTVPSIENTLLIMKKCFRAVDIIHMDNLNANTYTLDTWSLTTYGACEYLVVATSAMQMTRVLVMVNGSGNLWTTDLK